MDLLANRKYDFPNTQNIQLCCYCGVRKATTKDHIPPKSIFNKPRPCDLITVPYCFECNIQHPNMMRNLKYVHGLSPATENALKSQEDLNITIFATNCNSFTGKLCE